MKLYQHSFWITNLPIIGIVVGLLAITFLPFASFSSIDAFHSYFSRVQRTQQVLFELEQTNLLVRDAQTATRGFVIAGKSDFLVIYEDARRKLPIAISELTTLVADDSVQLQNVSLLKDNVDQVMGILEHTILLRRNSKTAVQAMTYVAEGIDKVSLEQMRTLVLKMHTHEMELLAQREQKIVTSVNHTKLQIFYGMVIAYLVFGVAFWKLVHEIRHRKSADKGLLEANNELVQHAVQLESANKELESFSYSISHDLRIPLRAIAGYAGMLAEDYEEKLDSEGQRLLNVIRENSKRMGALIDDLLVFSKLGRQALSLTNIDMRALAEHLLAEMRERDHSLNANVVLEDLPNAWGDRALLQQVWINLLSNALKYSSKTEAAEIRISGFDSGNETIYAVRDNGVGFDMQYYNKLFGVFQRLHSADEFPGTGVGLAIVQRIVQRHGGRVWAEGVLNQGATFFFALPHKDKL